MGKDKIKKSPKIMPTSIFFKLTKSKMQVRIRIKDQSNSNGKNNAIREG